MTVMAVLLHLQMGRGNRRSWIQGEESLITFVAKKESLRTYIAIELYIYLLKIPILDITTFPAEAIFCNKCIYPWVAL